MASVQTIVESGPALVAAALIDDDLNARSPEERPGRHRLERLSARAALSNVKWRKDVAGSLVPPRAGQIDREKPGGYEPCGGW